MACGATDSDATINPARTQMDQAKATAAILLAERIVVPSDQVIHVPFISVVVNYNTISNARPLL
jgi:hypothetical protein